jgi:putative ABC transport system permease protein
VCNVKVVFQDIRHALRVLRGSPCVTAAAITALALGIGANTAIFSLINAVLLRPLPYPHPEQLVYVSPTEGGHAMTSASWPVFLHWKQQTRAFEGLAAYTADNSATLTGGGDPVRVDATPVTREIFSVLGAAPLAGTLDGSVRTVVLSYGFWLRRFGGDRAALGRTLVLDGEPYTVAGILRPGFRFPRWVFMAEPESTFRCALIPTRNGTMCAWSGG